MFGTLTMLFGMAWATATAATELDCFRNRKSQSALHFELLYLISDELVLRVSHLGQL